MLDSKTWTLIPVILAIKGYYGNEGLSLACYLLKQTLAQHLTYWGEPEKNGNFVSVVPFLNIFSG